MSMDVIGRGIASEALKATRSYRSEFQRAADFVSAWDMANYPLNPSLTLDLRSGSMTADAGYNPLASAAHTAIVATGIEYHVFPDGNDTTGDGSFASPFKTLNKAIQAGNTAAQPFTVRWYGYTKASGATKTPAYYSRNNGGTTTTVPTQPLRVLFHGPIFAGISDNYTWTQPDSTNYPQLWQTTVNDVSRVTNSALLDRFGNASTYTQVASTAACRTTPGSRYHSGTTLQVHVHDGSQPTDLTCRVYRAVYAISWTSFTPAGSIFMYADPTEGGSLDIGGAVSIRPTGVPGSKHILYIADIRGRYAGGAADAKNAFEVYSWHGLVFTDRLTGGACSRDFLNIHNTLSTSGAMTHWIAQNCAGEDMGLGGNSQNAATAHEGVVSFVSGCSGLNASGGTFAFIDTTKTYLFGSIGRRDRGDGWTLLATDANAAELRTEGSALVWAERCAFEPIPGNPSLYALGGTILTRNCDYPAGSARLRNGAIGKF